MLVYHINNSSWFHMSIYPLLSTVTSTALCFKRDMCAQFQIYSYIYGFDYIIPHRSALVSIADMLLWSKKTNSQIRFPRQMLSSTSIIGLIYTTQTIYGVIRETLTQDIMNFNSTQTLSNYLLNAKERTTHASSADWELIRCEYLLAVDYNAIEPKGISNARRPRGNKCTPHRNTDRHKHKHISQGMLHIWHWLLWFILLIAWWLMIRFVLI